MEIRSFQLNFDWGQEKSNDVIIGNMEKVKKLPRFCVDERDDVDRKGKEVRIK